MIFRHGYLIALFFSFSLLPLQYILYRPFQVRNKDRLRLNWCSRERCSKKKVGLSIVWRTNICLHNCGCIWKMYSTILSLVVTITWGLVSSLQMGLLQMFPGLAGFNSRPSQMVFPLWPRAMKSDCQADQMVPPLSHSSTSVPHQHWTNPVLPNTTTFKQCQSRLGQHAHLHQPLS